MSTISANAQKLSAFFADKNISATSAKKADLDAAISATGLDKTQVLEARRFLMEQAVTNVEQGRGAGGLTGRGQVGAGHGQIDAQRGAVLVARTQNQSDPKLQAFEKSTYTLLDVEEVMKKTGLDAKGAKAKIGEHILLGTEAELRRMGISDGNFDSYELRDTFKRSSYSEDDAKKVLASFNFLTDLNDAKEYIGLKIVNGPSWEKDILGPIGVSPDKWDRHELAGAFSRSTYSDADVRRAKQAFDFLRGASNQEVKEYIGLKIVNGYEQMMAEAGITPHNFDRQDCLAAFAKSTYSKADVQKAKQEFDFLRDLPDVEVKEYIGLKIVNGYEEMLNEVGISQHTFDDHDCLAAFNASKYDAADVKAARDAFDFLKGAPDVEVKQYIGLKIVNHYEEMLSEVGIVQGPNKEPEIVSQQDMNRQAYANLEKAQAGLNDAAKDVRKSGIDTETKADLQRMLDSIKGYAAAEGNFAGNMEARGGSLKPLIDAGTQTRLTEQLTKELAGGFAAHGSSARIGDYDPQQVMNQKAYAAFEKADKKMEGLVEKLGTLLKDDPEGRQELKDAQSTFASFRDATATLAGNLEARGGSLYGLVYAGSAETLTKQRIATLQAHIDALS